LSLNPEVSLTHPIGPYHPHIWVNYNDLTLLPHWNHGFIGYPVVRRELRSYGLWVFIFPIKWGAKELPGVSQPHTSRGIIPKLPNNSG